MSAADSYVTVECVYKTQTKDAVLITQNNNEIWVPRSLLNYQTDKSLDNINRNDEFNMQVLQWFADKENLEYN